MRLFSSALRRAALTALLFLPAAAQTGYIDVAVTHGTDPVRDLQADAFRLTIGGQPQSLNAVRVRTGEWRAALVFDNGTVSAADAARIRRQAAAFLGAAAMPGRQFAVARWFAGMDVIQPFTADVQPLRGAVDHLGAAAATGKSASGGLSSGYAVDTGRQAGLLTPENMNGPGALIRTQHLMGSLAALCQSMARMPGRKSIWLLTGGGYLTPPGPDVERFTGKAMDACNLAHVSIHGLTNDVAFGQMLADRTGGSTVRLNDNLEQAMTRLAAADAEGYRLEFNEAAVKSGCHDVRVQVPKSMAARWTKRYCAP